MGEQDKAERCFICSIDRFGFFQKGDGFEAHIEKEHDPWNYIVYLETLRAKNRHDYNGMENYVMSQHDKDDVGFLPIGRSLVLQQLADREAESDEVVFRSSVLSRMEALEAK